MTAYAAQYRELWATLEIRPERLATVQDSARRIIENRARYEVVSAQTNVPWFVIGIMHKMECNCSFSKHLHNGDSLAKKTVRVPANRPAGTAPFDWTYSAVDALKIKKFDTYKTWDVETIAGAFEKYNGFGYRSKGINSPYLWSYTKHYTSGKYVRDHVFDRSAVSQQSGAMALLKAMVDMGAVSVDTAAPLPAPVVTEDETENLGKADGKPTGSRKWSLIEWLKGLFAVPAVGTAGFVSADQMGAAKTWLDTVKSFASDYGVTLLICLCVGGFVIAQIVQKLSEQDYQEGRYIPSGEAE